MPTEDTVDALRNETVIEVRKAKAQAWQECIDWFAIQGPLKGTRVPVDLLLEAEEANPYDTQYTAREPR
jgi:hypothetical protein